MTGFDAQQYEFCKEKAANMGIIFQIKGDWFLLSSSTTKKNYGKFKNVNDVLNFIYGYEACISDRS